MVTIGIWFYADPAGVQRTLQSVRAHTGGPYKLVMLGDGLPAPCEDNSDLVHLESAKAMGAAACFNRLIAHDDADVLVFLESGSKTTGSPIQPQ